MRFIPSKGGAPVLTTETSTDSKTPSPTSMSHTKLPTGTVEPLIPVTGPWGRFICLICSGLNSDAGSRVPVEPQSHNPEIGMGWDKFSDLM